MTDDLNFAAAQLRVALTDIDISAYNAAKFRIEKAIAILEASTKVSGDVPQTLSKTPADDIISQIEERFPNWRSYRDLVDCIDCTLHQLRAETQP